LFGAHLSIAGGMANALHEAESLDMDCVQVFTKNQRQWSVRPLRDDECEAWAAGLRKLGWHRKRASLGLQRVELERCETLEIPLCVVHPGAHLGEPAPPGAGGAPCGEPTRDELAGLKRVARALDRLHRDLPGYRVITCLETTAGTGTTLGYTFEQLAWIRENVREPQRVAFCFDTCHVTAAGYDMRTQDKAKAVLRRFNRLCGRRQLRVFHLNDSVGAVGCRRDRHAHIGHGRCGLGCFQAIVNFRAFDRVPKILETPKDTNDNGVPWDTVNVRRLKRMVRRRVGGR
jgi:deoxyribonuclease-4